jgi:hypothetical protein
MSRFLLLGFGVWLGATLLLRLSPMSLLRPDKTATILFLYAVSFGLVFLLVRRLVRRQGDPTHRYRAGIALLLPTLVLDAFASAFFPTVYPNFSASAAGVFGGWMLICCGGGLLALIRGK